MTGLIWLQNADCFGAVVFEAATDAAAGLADGQCGLTDGSSAGDWRLPTNAEWLATIARAVALRCFDEGAAGPPSLTNNPGTACLIAGPTFFFGIVSLPPYWSSSTDDTNPTAAYTVALRVGSDGAVTKESLTVHMWPVRGGR